MTNISNNWRRVRHLSSRQHKALRLSTWTRGFAWGAGSVFVRREGVIDRFCCRACGGVSFHLLSWWEDYYFFIILQRKEKYELCFTCMQLIPCLFDSSLSHFWQFKQFFSSLSLGNWGASIHSLTAWAFTKNVHARPTDKTPISCPA